MAATIIRLPKAPDPSSSAKSFREAMRELASGVSIVTTGSAPERNGFTATSVISLSVDPPRILTCLDRSTTALATLEKSQFFAVSILSRQHLRLAERFSGRTGEHGDSRFSDPSWSALETGAPVLDDALAAVDCLVEDLIPRETHIIAIGRVVATRVRSSGQALVYWRGSFDLLGAGGSEPSSGS